MPSMQNSLRILALRIVVGCAVLFQLVFRSEYIANFACGTPKLVEPRPPISAFVPTPSSHSSVTALPPDHELTAYELFESKLESTHAGNKHWMEVGFSGEGGKLCFVGSTSTLDELLHVFVNLLFLGQQLNRIVVVPPYFSNLYDVYLMETNGYIEVSNNQMFCDPRKNTPNVTQWNETNSVPLMQKWPDELHSRSDHILYIGGQELSKHESRGLFFSEEQQESTTKLLFANLFPYMETRTTVHEFIAEYFGDDSFVAVHLEPAKRRRATTDPAFVRWILQQHAPDLLDTPIFLIVSPEFQRRHPGIVRLFRENGAVAFTGLCPRRYECDMINREIASHSALFYSARNGAADRHIEHLRRWRRTVSSSFTRRPAIIRAVLIGEAKDGGWIPDIVSNAVDKTFPPTPFPTSPLSHYQKYMLKMDKKRPFVGVEKVFPPNGVICQLGLFEQLNNVIDQTAAMLMIGRQLNRTVVVPPHVSELYDVSYLERGWRFPRLRMPDGKMHRPTQASTNQSLCDPAHGWKFTRPLPKESIQKFIRRHSHERAPVLVLGAKDAFHYGFGKRALFKYLHPYKDTRDIALKFIDETFGNKPFVAVHLRFLDGKCYKVSKGDVGCDTDPELLRWILSKQAPELMNAKVFIASDHQRPDLEAAFARAGASFYRGKCHSYDKQCMLIDTEIAARSAFFYGLHLSTAAQNIERFRRQRENGTPFKQLYSFPSISADGEFGPTQEEWTPRRWKGKTGQTPEDYFASRPKENLNLVAITAAPVSSRQIRSSISNDHFSFDDNRHIEHDGNVYIGSGSDGRFQSSGGNGRFKSDGNGLLESDGNGRFESVGNSNIDNDNNGYIGADGIEEDDDDEEEGGGAENENENEIDDERQKSGITINGGLKTSESGSTFHSEHVRQSLHVSEAVEKHSSCHQQFEIWIAPMLWLFLFLLMAYPPRVRHSTRHRRMRLGCWRHYKIHESYQGVKKLMRKRYAANRTAKVIALD